MPWHLLPLALAAGFLTGFINTLAGAGSAVSLAMLNLLGLPLEMANGTNRVAILMQSAMATASFHRQGRMPWTRAAPVALPFLLGSAPGAWIAVSLPREQLRLAIGVVMVVMLALLLARPKRWLVAEDAARPVGPGGIALYFLFGLYAGFVQIGVGVFLLCGLVLAHRIDLVRANALKVLAVVSGCAPALAIFLWKGQVVWIAGFVLGLGAMAGAWVGTTQAAKHGAPFVRWVLIAVVTIAALRYLGLLGWIADAVA